MSKRKKRREAISFPLGDEHVLERGVVYPHSVTTGDSMIHDGPVECPSCHAIDIWETPGRRCICKVCRATFARSEGVVVCEVRFDADNPTD